MLYSRCLFMAFKKSEEQFARSCSFAWRRLAVAHRRLGVGLISAAADPPPPPLLLLLQLLKYVHFMGFFEGFGDTVRLPDRSGRCPKLKRPFFSRGTSELENSFAFIHLRLLKRLSRAHSAGSALLPLLLMAGRQQSRLSFTARTSSSALM